MSALPSVAHESHSLSPQGLAPSATIRDETSPAHWVVGDSIDCLPRIFDDGVTISVMQRELADDIRESAHAVMQRARPLEWYWRGQPGDAMCEDLARRLGRPVDDALIQDVQLLAEAMAYLFEAEQIGVRLRKLDSAMCPRFHVDKLGVRFLTTYAGPGTEWLPEHAIDRAGLGAPHPDKPSIVQDVSQVRQLECGDLALLKGSGWIGNEAHGLVHRSPPGDRLLLAIDPG